MRVVRSALQMVAIAPTAMQEVALGDTCAIRPQEPATAGHAGLTNAPRTSPDVFLDTCTFPV